MQSKSTNIAARPERMPEREVEKQMYKGIMQVGFVPDLHSPVYRDVRQGQEISFLFQNVTCRRLCAQSLLTTGAIATYDCM